MGAAITDAAGSSTAGVCSDESHSTARGNATSSNGEDIRGDAARDLARVVRDGSTPEGQRLREQLWVWLHLQDEEATEPEPKHLQSWLTGQKAQQRKEFKRNRRKHSSQTDLIEIFSPPRIIPHAVRQGLRTTTPTNLDLTEDWDATTVTGRDKLEDILKRQKTLDDNSQTLLRTLLEYVWDQRETERFSGTGEDTAKCFGITRSGHVGCVDTASDGQEISVWGVLHMHRHGIRRWSHS